MTATEKGTAGKLHAEMHSATVARLNAYSNVGRKLKAYGDACELLGRGEVNPPFVDRHHRALDEAISALVAAAFEEGAA